MIRRVEHAHQPKVREQRFHVRRKLLAQFHASRARLEQDVARFDIAVNDAVAHACRKNGVLVNVTTASDEGTFIVPSVVERGDLLIAISTCGDSPALARRIREELEQTYGPEYGEFLEKMALLRRRLLKEVPSEEDRRKIFQALVDADILYLLRGGQVHEADHRIAEIVKAVAG